MKSKHIKIRVVDSGVDVVVDDQELFDYVDDVLTDLGLEAEFVNEEECDGEGLFVMHFGSGVSAERVASAVETIPEDEVERIWKQNN